jgi:FkbM family methyltransferase
MTTTPRVTYCHPSLVAPRRFYYRPIGGHDEFIIGENLRGTNQYDRLGPLSSGDVVLDVGAHIGAFTVFAAARARFVVAVEPLPANLRLLRRNLRGLSNVRVVSAAVDGTIDVPGPRPFFVARNENHYLGSLYVDGGRRRRSVKVIPFLPLLYEVRPTYLKLDCEAAEYNLLDWRRVPGYVEVIVFEAHLSRRAWRDVAYPKLLRDLRRSGFVVRAPEIKRRWSLVVAASRRGWRRKKT